MLRISSTTLMKNELIVVADQQTYNNIVNKYTLEKIDKKIGEKK